MKIKNIIIRFSDSNRLMKKCKINYWRIKNLSSQYKVEKGIKKRKNGINDKFFDEIKRYENKYIGQRCFIVATGPSLTVEDLLLIKNEIVFGMNSIVKIFHKIDWRPTYYGIQDRYVYEKLEEVIKKYYNNAHNVFVADQLDNFFVLPSNFIRFPYNGNYHLYTKRYNDYPVKFSPNSYEVVYDGYSITYSLIQIAIYMGFKEIYLLGCDCNYSQNEKNHFIDSGYIDKNAESNPKRMCVGYEKAKEYADSHGIKIINCTRGGMLEVFPRANLTDILVYNNL